jgi:hypothetical protein
MSDSFVEPELVNETEGAEEKRRNARTTAIVEGLGLKVCSEAGPA